MSADTSQSRTRVTTGTLLDWKRLRSNLLLLAGLLAALGLALALISGRAAVEKVLTALAMPAGLVWLTLTLAVLQVRDEWRRPRGVLTILAWLTVSILGNSHVNNLLYRDLEGEYRTISPYDQGTFDTIVVLGGGCSVAANGQVSVNSGGDRVIVAARMYHRGLTSEIVCTGERIQSLQRGGMDQSRQAETILRELSVPADIIRRVGGINTAAEMENLSGQFDATQRVGLITSAWHMPRAMRLARNAGLEFVPLPANLVSSRDSSERPRFGEIVLSLIPSAGAMAGTTSALKEYLATAVGR